MTSPLTELQALDDATLEARLAALLDRVQPRADAALAQRLQQRLDRLTKPTGALGRLEALALQIGVLQGRTHPRIEDPQLMVFAADHGLARQGVSAYPQEVTWQMVANMLGGGAAVNVLARQHALALTLVDAGVAHDVAALPGAAVQGAPRGAGLPDGVVDAKLGAGTQDASAQAAMTPRQARLGLLTGAALVRARPGQALVLGEMGIGNTASAALLLHRLAGVPLETATGRGTGLDDAGLAHKRAVLQRCAERAPDAQDPLTVLAEFGGFEIAMMAGAALQAAAERRVLLVDGFIVSAAVLLAWRLAPAVREACVFAHLGAEQGHAALLQVLGAQPLLQGLGLRLGEGSGAALAWPLLESSLRLLDQMASFESAQVSDRA
ncbi:MAG: hypothetical protein RL223_2988 [Pseudomonadota bacterium]|jgi:nicotinate-nucleotide--dimethylbenzimidazole phosphoribosyltransferase